MVEIGTGTGVSGLWLLRGMRPDGVLTTIDVEAEHQRVARRVFAAAGLAPSRTRIITGRALDVLPRLADGVYDLVFVDHDRLEYAPRGRGRRGCCGPAVSWCSVTRGAAAGSPTRPPATRETVALRDVAQSAPRRGRLDARVATDRRRAGLRRAPVTRV